MEKSLDRRDRLQNIGTPHLATFMSKVQKVQALQIILQKAKLAQVETGRQIKHLNKAGTPFISFVQEPKVDKGKLSWQPNSCKKYSVPQNPRTAIYTDNYRTAWALESLNTRDLTAIQTKINTRSVILASVYLDITWIKVIPD